MENTFDQKFKLVTFIKSLYFLEFFLAIINFFFQFKLEIVIIFLFEFISVFSISQVGKVGKQS